MGERMRLGLVGPGDVAERDYLPEFHRIADRAEIAAVCGRGEGRARAVAERFGVPWFTDVARMCDEVDLDAALNLTPIQQHEAVTAALLAGGLHVYSEKPFAGSVAAGRRLAGEARRRGRTIVAAPSVLVFPQLLEARRLLDAGAIGAVRSARGVAFAGPPPWPGYASDPSPFFTEGGGPLVDMAVYPLHALTGLLGSVRRVAGAGLRSRDRFVVGDGPHAGAEIPIEVPDTWAVLLELATGTVATVEANFSAHGTHAPALELHGSDGSLTLDPLDVATPIELLRDGEWVTHPVPGVARAGGPDHILGVGHLVEVVRDGVENVLTPEHAIHVLEVLERAGAGLGGSELATTVAGDGTTDDGRHA